MTMIGMYFRSHLEDEYRYCSVTSREEAIRVLLGGVASGSGEDQGSKQRLRAFYMPTLLVGVSVSALRAWGPLDAES